LLARRAAEKQKASSAEFAGKPWPQGSDKARFSAKKRLEMHAEVR